MSTDNSLVTSIQEEAEILVKKAAALNVVLTIEQKSLWPPAMGRYETVVTTREVFVREGEKKPPLGIVPVNQRQVDADLLAAVERRRDELQEMCNQLRKALSMNEIEKIFDSFGLPTPK